MGAAKKLIDKKVLRDLVPINALSAAHVDEISRKAVIEDLRSGSYLFKKGDRDYQTVYLLDGRLEFVDAANNVLDTLTAGTEQARHPVAHKRPRQVGARARGKATVARVDTNLLDVLLTWDESAGYDVVEIDSQDDGDWMTRMLQSQAFMQLPPANIHQLLMRLEAINASAGDVIVQQGDEGDYFYIVKSGRLAVTRKASAHSKEVLLAELGEGACFGEEALVSGTHRNASVMMVTDGTLMRLSKNDFDELLCAPLVHEVDFQGAQELVARGAQWLDVRLPGEFGNQAVKGSLNLPLSALREQCAALDSGTDYIVCCDTGRRSAAGAFVLSQRGLRVHALKRGLMDVPEEALVTPPSGTDRDAEILPFESDTRADARAAGQQGEDPVREGSADIALIDKLAAAESDKLALQQEVTRLETRVAALDCQLEELAADADEQSKALRDDLEAARGEVDSNRQQLAAGQQQRDKRLQELEQELGRLRDDYQQLGQRTSAVAGERDAANRELQEVRQQMDALQERLGSGETETQAQQARLQQALAQRDEAVAAAEAELRSLRQQLDEAGKTSRQLEQRLAAAGEQAVSGQSQAAQLQAALETDLDNANRQIETLQADLRAAQTRFEQRHTEADSEAQTLNQRIAELQQQLDSAGGEINAQRDSLAERAEQLQQELRDLQGGREHLEQACALASAEKDQLAGEMQSLQRTVEKLREQAQQQQATREQLQQQLDEKTSREEALQGELQAHGRQDEARSNQWQQQFDEARARSAALEADLEASQRQRQEAERRNAEAEARIAALIKEHKSDLDGSRNALTRAQTETENLKREHSRVMESLRKAERTLERERQDQEGELYRLRRELQDAAGESSDGLTAELEAMQAKLQEGLRAREDMEIRLGERSAQLEDAQAEADRLVLQLQQAQESARQAEQQLLDSKQAANEEMAARLEAEERARQALRKELDAAVAERSRAREQLTVHTQELDELRQAVDTAQRQAASQTQLEQQQLEKLRRERDEALEQQRHSEQELDAARGQQRRIQQEIDQLRAEAEVTRGLVDMQAAGAGNSALREQLDLAKKNVDVAVRLRSQAEEKNARLEAELAGLKSRLQAVETASAGLIPSLDESDPHAAAVMDPGYGAARDAGNRPVTQTRPAARPAVSAVLLDDPRPGRSGGGFGSLLAGAVLGALAAGAGGWWLLTQPSPLLESLLPGGSADSGQVAGARVAGDLHATPEKSAAATESTALVSKRDTPPADTDKPKHVQAAEPATERVQHAMRIPDFIKGGASTADIDSAAASTQAQDSAPELAVAAESPGQESVPEPPTHRKVQQPSRVYSDVLNDGARAPTLVEFQSDSFEMGSGASSANFDERPRHRVQLRRFAISAGEITFDKYDRFARATGRRLPADNGWGRGGRPVINVSWQDAVAYASWLSEQTGSRYRLPSEAEWEFVAHAGSDTRFWWGNEAGAGQANCFDCGSEWSGRMTAPAGSFAASAYRVHDMAGNVMEWVQDCYQPDYSTAPADGSAVSSGDCSRRVVRGGAYNSPSESLRSTSRDVRETGTRLDNLGFRVVKE